MTRWSRILIGCGLTLGAMIVVSHPLPQLVDIPVAGGDFPDPDGPNATVGAWVSLPPASPAAPGSSASRPSADRGYSGGHGPTATAGSGQAPMLISNEYAYHHPGALDAVRSADWIVTSGSLYGAANLLWSGPPDDHAPGPTSALGTDSAVLRAVSTRTDLFDVRVSFAVRLVRMIQTPRTPEKNTDGVHVFLRYQSEFSTYYVSVLRRDGQITIKKKVPGGPSNGGTYYTLGSARAPVEPGESWHQVQTLISRTGPGSVRVTLTLDGRPALDVIDDGASAPAITSPGRVGLRGDNCEFYVRDFAASPVADQ